jgi:Prion-inhibition and propagation
MVEPIGLTVGLLSLAGLFSTCIDCFDFYEASKDCGDELRTLLVQLDLEKTRLLTWAEHVGLVNRLDSGGTIRQLIRSKFQCLAIVICMGNHCHRLNTVISTYEAIDIAISRCSDD